MSRIVFCTASTLDGFLADDTDSLDWLFAVPDADAATAFGDFLPGVGVLVMGSTTYRWVYEHERLDQHPERWSASYADRPTFVFSSHPQPQVAGADITFVAGEVATHLPAITAAAGDRDVWVVGGGDLAGQFADIGRLDAIIVTYAPAVVGSGRPILPRRIGPERLSIDGVRRDGPFAEVTLSVRR